MKQDRDQNTDSKRDPRLKRKPLDQIFATMEGSSRVWRVVPVGRSD